MLSCELYSRGVFFQGGKIVTFLNTVNAVDAALLLAGVVILALAIRAMWVHYTTGNSPEEAGSTALGEDGIDNNLSTLLRLPIAIWLIALMAYLALHFTPWGLLHVTEGKTINLYAGKVFKAMTVLLVFIGLLRLLNRSESQVLSGKRKINQDFEQLVHVGFKLAKFGLYVITIGALLTIFDLKELVNKLLALGAVSSIVIGFAAQDTLANFFGSAMVMLDRPFKVNDSISSPDKDIKGIVEYIGWRVTRVRDLQYGIKYIPNNNFTKITINNLSQARIRKFTTSIGVRYEDLGKVPKICEEIENALRKLDAVDQNTQCYAKFSGLGDSSVNFTVLCSMKTSKEKVYANFVDTVLNIVVKVVKKNKADFPFPTTTLDAQDLVESLKGKVIRNKE
jgi:MscS family membrane protein